MLNVLVNSYGHVRTVSSPNYTFFLGKLDSSTSRTYFCLLLTTTLLDSAEGRRMVVEIISLSISMNVWGPGRDWTHNPWICNQTHICSQTRYRLCYAAWYNTHTNVKFKMKRKRSDSNAIFDLINADFVFNKTYFLIPQHKHMLWALKRTVSLRRFFWVPKTNFKHMV